MMKMMKGDRDDMKGMKGCGMQDKSWSITTGQIVGMTGSIVTGVIATGN
jgi:hypothetical protein